MISHVVIGDLAYVALYRDCVTMYDTRHMQYNLVPTVNNVCEYKYGAHVDLFVCCAGRI